MKAIWLACCACGDYGLLQREVEGYIEAVTLPYGAAIICNEEGRLHGLPYNCCVFGTSFVGTVLVVGTKGEEFCDVPPIDGFVEVLRHG